MDSLPAARPALPPAAPEEGPAPVRVGCAGSLDALEALRADWLRLWSADPDASPFQSPHWLLPWWKHLGQGSLAAWTVRCAATGELVGLAPLYLYTDEGGRRHLFPVGVGTTDHLDLLARPGWTGRVLRAVATAIAERARDVDIVELPQLRSGAALLGLPLPAGWHVEVTRAEPSPVLSLAGMRAGLPVPQGMAQNIRNARARAARAGTVGCERASAADVQPFLDVLVRLHRERWTGKGSAGVLADPAVRAFHREAAPLLHEAGLLRLYVLRLAGECIAALYCLADLPPRRERRFYYYIGGWTPRHAALGPGTLLIAHAIEEAMAEGASAFDFLRGAEPYKYRWGAVDQAMYVLRAWQQ